MNNQIVKIGIIGLGYVGLPLATEFGKKFSTIGFDINQKRIDELSNGKDITNEVDSSDFSNAKKLSFTSNSNELRECNYFIVTVPTPIDINNQPDISALESASQTVGKLLKKDDIVVYESTVYPGLTEEICVPILESASDLTANEDFYYGYSPERINPGDKEHRITDIKKITSGSTEDTSKAIDKLYSSIIKAGTYRASSVMVAESAKVIENIQRDVNIALVNELSIIFNKMGIDTEEVLKAAGTKWNFHNYKPGLVGGHCIGVDPHYLRYKAKEIGIDSKMITAGRELNEYMSLFVADKVFELMISKDIEIENSKILILGFSFKENCPDFRNTKVADLYKNLSREGNEVHVHDPWVEKADVYEEYGIEIIDVENENYYDAVVLAVAHSEFKKLTPEILKKYCKQNHIIFDMKHLYDASSVEGRL
tara:strand:+ start:8103 stop:9377 length:1275 start_codon:yes stop_codon:yes gene_type:complete